MSEPLVFVDDVERAGWFTVYASALVALDGRSRAAREYADDTVKHARDRCGQDLQAENAQLRQEIADARATIDQLRDELAQTTEHVR